MENHPIRFSHDLWAAVKIAAKHKGESPSEYVRTAVLSRCAYDLGARDDAVGEAFRRLWDAAARSGRELAEIYDLDDEGP